jgi:hypothetical protein
MKYVKMFGLAAVAAMALMAFAGAGSASATVLCKVHTLTTGCAAGGQDYAAKTTIHATHTTGTTGILETTGGTTLVTCSESTISGETTNTGSSTTTVDGPVKSFTFGGCTNTVDVIKLGSLEIHHISGTDNGTLTAKETEVTVNGIFGESCIYGAGAGLNLGTLVGSVTTKEQPTDPAKITINTIVKRTGGGGFCPAETRWTASYTVTSPSPLYVSAS